MTTPFRARRFSRLVLFISSAIVLTLSPLFAQSVPPLDATRVVGGFSLPLFATAPPGDKTRLFVVQQGGKIRIVDLASKTIKATDFLNISSEVSTSGEEGLLGLAFAPDYATSGRFYVDYVAPGGSFGQGVTHIASFQVSSNPDVADATSEKTLLTFDQPQTNHKAGWIGFSPRAGDTGNLYIATGDGGNANDQGPGHIEPGGNAQNLTTFLGKMLRIHPETAGGYTIPANNPFAGSTTAKQEIWLYGLRNPFRDSFDRSLGTMLIGDVGQDTREEVDVQDAANPGGGENYGWRAREGFIQNPAFPTQRVRHAVDPVYDYPHTVGQTVIGGYIYRGRKIPNLQGFYVFADYLGPNTGNFTGKIWALTITGTTASNFQDITADLFPTRIGGFSLQNPSSLGEDAKGGLYICDISSGNLFQITAGRN